MEEKFYFYYTNDLHSDFKQWPRVVTYLKEARALRNQRGESNWTIDIGDHVDRSHSITEATMGKANVKLLNDAGYDYVTIGNNEGITMSHQDLYHLYDEAAFEVTCANLHSTDNMQPPWLRPTVNIETKHGVKIGMIGLTAPFNAFYELLNWYVSPEFEVLDKYMKDLENSVDIIIVMSHLGITIDQEIARRYDAVDAIIGGHTHHLLRSGEYINNAVITAAGKHCAYIGEVILTWDHKQKKLVKKEAYTADITHLEKDAETEQTLHVMLNEANSLLGETVVQIDSPLTVNWYKDTPIMQELTNTVKEWTKADAAMLNNGLLLESLPVGAITYGDIHRICPHPINPVVVDLKGNELIEVVRVSLTKEFMQLALKGFGFRGKVLGRMMFAGIQVETGFHKNGEEYVKQVLLENGEEIDPDRTYYIATADTFTFGRLLPEVAKSDSKQYFVPEFLRDLLAKTLRAKFPYYS
ncbi:bifunctional UDP-sugar hydrolase/5'-nucleotidase [Oceanobacillus profundus]|uniref:bifunctional metallophosphatase/5'-nucleotidase n=1 Tax=Oceanobacillus TaxID=182709 RepID=UPI0026E39266|nr:bifunctional UDP-sugar hydrolase/5'-nucleotidase [Oceanobacillus profundus]MDO6449125.1 bifunctional UDP-sugar hydrolase/5'-nucleotidase [Oceanobacillus profundus]